MGYGTGALWYLCNRSIPLYILLTAHIFLDRHISYGHNTECLYLWGWGWIISFHCISSMTIYQQHVTKIANMKYLISYFIYHRILSYPGTNRLSMVASRAMSNLNNITICIFIMSLSVTFYSTFRLYIISAVMSSSKSRRISFRLL